MGHRALLIGLAVIVPAGTWASSFEVCTATGDQWNVAVSCDLIVWVDERLGSDNTDIWGYDLATASEFLICGAPGNQQRPSVYGRTVVWQDQRSGTDYYDWDIYMRDMDGGAEQLVYGDRSSRGQWRPSIYDDVIVWDGIDKIWGYSISGGSEFLICDDVGDSYRAWVYGDTVIWSDRRSGTDWDIYGYDLGGGGEFPIAVEPGHQNYSKMSGNIVIWNDNQNSATTGWDIHGYDLGTDTPLVITDFVGDELGPEISDGVVIWEDYRTGTELVYAKDLANGNVFRVCSDDSTQHDPFIYGTTVAWQDLRDEQEDFDIYATDIPEPGTAALVLLGLVALAVRRRKVGSGRV